MTLEGFEQSSIQQVVLQVSTRHINTLCNWSK